MTWATAALGEVCDIVSGATPRTTEKKFWGGNILWTTPKDLSDLDGVYLETPPRTITEEGLKSCAASLLPVNSVLLSSRAPIGLVAINTVPMATNQGFKSLVPDSRRVDSKFLFHWLKSRTSFLQGLGNGATFKEISKAVVERIEIPLPPLDEQRRIAAILDKADALRRKRKRALDLLDSLTRSIFLEMFGEPGLSKRFPQVPLSEIATKITDGEHQNPEFTGAGMPIVMASQVLDDGIDIGEAKFVSIEDGERFRRKCGPEKGDILIVGRGATIGRTSIVDVSTPFCLMGSVILIKPETRLVDSSYLTALFKFPRTRAALYNTSGSSAQQAIYLSHLKRMRLLLPPVENQREFAERAERIAVGKSFRFRHAGMIEMLFSSLQSRAFSGQL